MILLYKGAKVNVSVHILPISFFDKFAQKIIGQQNQFLLIKFNHTKERDWMLTKLLRARWCFDSFWDAQRSALFLICSAASWKQTNKNVGQQQL